MKKTTEKKPSVYANVYASQKILIIDRMAKDYTIPKLYIPKDGNGKPSVAPGANWYVWYYFRNPATGRLDRTKPVILKGGINRYKTVRERKAFGKQLVVATLGLLKDGYSPFEHIGYKQELRQMTIVEALDLALENKKNEVKESTYIDYKHRKEMLEKWLSNNGMRHTLADNFTKQHAAAYLNHLSKNSSNRNVNNHSTVLSALFGKLENDDIIKTNPFFKLSKRQTTPVMHRAYTEDELQKLKDYLTKNDPYLLDFMRFIAYSFMRNVEVLRLRVKNIDTKRWKLTVDTKTGVQTIPVTRLLRPVLERFDLENCSPDDFLFTPNLKPGPWPTKQEKHKVDWFSKRFRKAKKALGLDFDHTAYAMKHTAAVNLYEYFINEGCNDKEAILKMMPITRHKSETALRNYLRSVNAFAVEDFSDKLSMDF